MGTKWSLLTNLICSRSPGGNKGSWRLAAENHWWKTTQICKRKLFVVKRLRFWFQRTFFQEQSKHIPLKWNKIATYKQTIIRWRWCYLHNLVRNAMHRFHFILMKIDTANTSLPWQHLKQIELSHRNSEIAHYIVISYLSLYWLFLRENAENIVIDQFCLSIYFVETLIFPNFEYKNLRIQALINNWANQKWIDHVPQWKHDSSFLLSVTYLGTARGGFKCRRLCLAMNNNPVRKKRSNWWISARKI